MSEIEVLELLKKLSKKIWKGFEEMDRNARQKHRPIYYEEFEELLDRVFEEIKMEEWNK